MFLVCLIKSVCNQQLILVYHSSVFEFLKQDIFNLPCNCNHGLHLYSYTSYFDCMNQKANIHQYPHRMIHLPSTCILLCNSTEVQKESGYNLIRQILIKTAKK